MIPIYQWKRAESRDYLQKLCLRGTGLHSGVDAEVAEIICAVRERGDTALVEFTKKLDGVELGSLRIEAAEIHDLASEVDPELRRILSSAKENIRRFHQHQIEKSWEFEAEDGVHLGQRIRPLRVVGLYVPGGTAAYPSTVLMNAIPAQIAGVPRIVVVTPYQKFKENPILAAVLQELNLDEVYGVGGAQAIAGLAFGTATLPKVDKIVGPGNVYVASAKRQVFGSVDIDLIAGPSEVVVVADDTANPDFVAADLMAQAEHDENACAIAVTLSHKLAHDIQNSLVRLIKNLTREMIIRRALEGQGAILVCSDLDEAAEVVNSVAPEHLELLMKNPESFAEKIHSAGAVFFGPYSCEAVGDYFAGPNHVLPTSGTARFASPLGVYDFLKRTNVIKYTQQALEKNHTFIEKFALVESLDAHARSLSIRFHKG